MTLANIVLEKLSDAQPAAGRHEVAFADENTGWSLYLTADRRDEMSVRAWEFSLRRAESAGDVSAWAHRLAETTGGLFEALTVVEVDAPRRQALVRSAKPVARQGSLFYFELLLQGCGSVLVRRYKASRTGKKREQIAFAVTHEALAGAVEDLTKFLAKA